MVFFFQKKKQKAFLCFAEASFYPRLSEADPGGLGGVISFFSKRTKELSCFAEVAFPQDSAKPTQGVWGLAPKKLIDLLLLKREASVGVG
jgi:hypothetical protein